MGFQEGSGFVGSKNDIQISAYAKLKDWKSHKQKAYVLRMSHHSTKTYKSCMTSTNIHHIASGTPMRVEHKQDAMVGGECGQRKVLDLCTA